MSVRLEALSFNHDPRSHDGDALNIRLDASRSLAVPEWRRGRSVRPADAPAAYSLEATRGRTITVRARLSRQDRRLAAVEVRAVAPPVTQAYEPWLSTLLGPFAAVPSLYWSYWTALTSIAVSLPRPDGGPVLGEVAPRVVAFDAAGRADVVLPLTGTRIWTRGVGAEDMEWHWQWRPSPGVPWTVFAVTRHRIYTLIDVPTAPWRQTPYTAANTQLPWRDVLEFACAWARGASDADAAAELVTAAVFGLGPGLVSYDCPGGGITHYTLPFTPHFDCTAFLERLRGGLGNGYYLNCTDCAAIVSTFANAVGCDLWQSTMGFRGVPFFQVNPIRSIGAAGWSTPCGWGAFDYHEVAWKGDCGVDDEVFDACLEVDADVDPTVWPHMPRLPTNMLFGFAGDGQYRDRLAAVAGRADCEPVPSTRVRRMVF